MADLKALIFDVDGTLAETEKVGHLPAFNEAFRKADLNWNWDETMYADLLSVTGGKERILYFINQYKPSLPNHISIEELILMLHKEKTKFYHQIVSSGRLKLKAGIARLIGEARKKGILLAIATTTHPDNVISLLNAALAPDSHNWFKVIAAGDIVKEKKPAPDIYKFALDQLSLPASACIAFEDSRNGLLSALGAGIPVIVTKSFYTEKEDFTGAKLVCNHPGEETDPCIIERCSFQKAPDRLIHIDYLQSIINE